MMLAAGLNLAHVWMTGLFRLSPALTGSLIAAVWQGALLAALAGLALHLLPRTPATVRFAIWFGVFLIVTALPGISRGPHSASVAPVAARGPWLMVDPRWSLAVAAVWAGASLLRAITLVAAGFRVRALWMRATPLQVGVAQLAMGSRHAQICVSDEVDRPTVIGFFSPKILIPNWLLEQLTSAELEQIVLHEAEHLSRADDWMNLLQKIALVIFPLNPALAWVEQRLCFERELAVDERVLAAFAGKPGAAVAYAQCLTTLAQYRLGRRRPALALGALGRESELGRRIGRILTRQDRMRPLHAKLVLGGAMLGLLVAATGFERCPQVVGFNSAKAESLAETGADKVTDPRMIARGATAIGVRRVSYKLPADNYLPTVPHVLNGTKVAAVDPQVQLETEQSALPASARNGRVPAHMVQTMASVAVHRNQLHAVPNTEPPQPATAVAQWVVVTEWQGRGGMRSSMVLTAATAPDQTETNAAASSGPTAPEDQVHPYAAVPVRGGWLVFQL